MRIASRWGRVARRCGGPARDEVARRVGRDVKAAHGDVHALLDAGVAEKTKGGVLFPYDGVHVDFRPGEAA
jgi:predicted transcriptional regulator